MLDGITWNEMRQHVDSEKAALAVIERLVTEQITARRGGERVPPEMLEKIKAEYRANGPVPLTVEPNAALRRAKWDCEQMITVET